MNSDIRKKLEDLNKLLAAAVEPVVDDETQKPTDPADDITDTLLQFIENNQEPPPGWWQQNWQWLIELLGGTVTVILLIKWLLKKKLPKNQIKNLLDLLKGKCPPGSNDACCVAIKKLAGKLVGQNGDIPAIMDGIAEIAADLAALAGCPWARDIILALLEAYLLGYLLALGMTKEQALKIIKQILEWIMGGAQPGAKPVLVPNDEVTSPQQEECKPDKDKIKQGLWDKYGQQITDTVYAAAVIAAIVFIILAAIAACGGTWVGCAGLPEAVTAIIALLASIGINITEDEAQDLIKDSAALACVEVGTTPVLSSADHLSALRAALRKRMND